MKTLIRNFFYTFRKFFLANVLNIIGLGIAFTAFYVIMAQVIYDYGYNRSVKDSDKIYRVTFTFSDPEYRTFGSTMPRPLGENIVKSSPHITAYGMREASNAECTLKVGENTFKVGYRNGIKDYVSVYQPDMLSGTAASLGESDSHILISESQALRFFGTIDALNKNLQLVLNSGKIRDLVVTGIFRDYPKNSSFHDVVFRTNDENADSWNNWNYTLYIRIDDNSNLEQVRGELHNSILTGLGKRNGDDGKEADAELMQQSPLNDVDVQLTSLNDEHFMTGTREKTVSHSSIYMLVCFSLLIVFIAAVNFMNFFLAETPMRLRSINTQKVLGATAAQLRGGLLAEAVMISLLSFLLSLLLVTVTADMGVQQLVQATLGLGSNAGLLAGLLGVSVLVGLLAGLYPSHYVTSFPPALVLKGSFGLSPRGKVLRTTLVAVQFVISFILVLFIGIMLMQSRYIYTSDYGYDRDRLIVADGTPETVKSSAAVKNRLRSIGGVECVSFSYQTVNTAGNNLMRFSRGSGDRRMEYDALFGDNDYPAVMGLKITEGRTFNETDRDVVIFNEATRKKFPFVEHTGSYTADSLMVVGFCGNFRYKSFRTDDLDEPLALILIGDGNKQYSLTLDCINVRVATGADMRAVRSEIQSALEEFAPNHDFNVRFMDQVLEQTYKSDTLFIKQVLLLSLLAVAISVIGVFGLTMFESEYRRKEIGIRKVLGSTTAQIVQMLCRRYALILVTCFAIAAPAGYITGTRWLESFAVKTQITPLLFVAAFALIAVITFATVALQSWKTANANPVESIRTE